MLMRSPQLPSCKALRRGEGGGDGRTWGLLGRSACGGLREPSGQGPAGPRGLRNALPTPSGGSPFPPETRVPLADLGLGPAQMSSALAIPGGDAECGASRWRALATPASSLVGVALPPFRLLPASAEHRLSHLPLAAQGHPGLQPQPCHRSGYPPPTPPPWAALLPASACPVSSRGGLESSRLLPGGPPRGPCLPPARPEGPWPCQGDQILSATCCFH